MSGRAFLAMWVGSLAFTGLVASWAFWITHELHGPLAEILGAGVPLLAVMAGMWLVVRR